MPSDYRLSLSKEISLQVLDDELLPSLPEPAVGRYIVDLSNLSFTRVPGVVNILLLIEYLRRRGETSPTLILPKASNVVSFLSNMRFFVLAENICRVKKARPLPEPVKLSDDAGQRFLEILPVLPRETDEGYLNKLGRRVQNTLIDRLSNMQNGRFAFLSGVYLELCKNIFEHSRSFGFVGAQSYGEWFQITIGDVGIGIFESLQPFYEQDREHFRYTYGPVWDEAKALDIAFSPLVSRKRAVPGEEGVGAGLWTVLCAAHESGGSVICRTGGQKVFLGYRRSKWVTERKGDLVPFPGTQLELYFPLGKR